MRRLAFTDRRRAATLLATAGVTLLAACGSSTYTATSGSPVAASTSASIPGESQAVSNPNEVVARVGATTITRAQVDHWMRTLGGETYYSASNSLTLPEGLLSDPPDYPRCVTTIEREASKSPLGHAREDSSELLAKCRQLNQSVESYAAGHLVQIQQMLHIAHEQHIEPTTRQITQRFDHVKASTYPSKKQLAEYLASHRMAISDLILEVKLDLISEAFVAKIKPETPLGHARYTSEEKHWIAQTNCKPGYTVPGCENYTTTNPYLGNPAPLVLMEQLAATFTDKCTDVTACGKQAGIQSAGG